WGVGCGCRTAARGCHTAAIRACLFRGTAATLGLRLDLELAQGQGGVGGPGGGDGGSDSEGGGGLCSSGCGGFMVVLASVVVVAVGYGGEWGTVV
nr:hypothetical protein [Tanacetum cinerariifolium]